MIYKIQNKYLEVEIATMGAEIKSIKYLGVDYLHDSNPKYWCYSAPILWPNIGCLKNGVSLFNGVSYPMKKHGIARVTEFTCCNETNTSLTFILSSNQETNAIYPFDFDLIIKYELEERSIKSTINVINKSTNDMPFNLGLHPAFKVPLSDDETFEDYHVLFDKTGTYEVPYIDLVTGLIDYTKRPKELINFNELNLKYEDFDADAIVLENVLSHSVILESKNSHHGVKFDFPEFTHFGMWTPGSIKKAPFICLEPWIGCADRPQSDGEFSSKRDLVWLKPTEEKAFNYQFTFF